MDQIFRIFDKDGDGTIDFKVSKVFIIAAFYGCNQEFMLATDMTASGSAEEKLYWTFKMFDLDGSGTRVKKTFDIDSSSKRFFKGPVENILGESYLCSS